MAQVCKIAVLFAELAGNSSSRLKKMEIDLRRTFRSALIVTVACAAVSAQNRGDAVLNGCSGEVTVRNAHGLIYDADRRRIVLFGGADASTVLGDLWEWYQGKWRCLADARMLARTFPAMAYDRKRKRIVMFGGNRVSFRTGPRNEEHIIVPAFRGGISNAGGA